MSITLNIDMKAQPKVILLSGEYQSEPGKLGQVVGNFPKVGAANDLGFGGGNWLENRPALETTRDFELMDQAQDLDSHAAAVNDRGNELGIQEFGFGRLDFIEEIIDLHFLVSEIINLFLNSLALLVTTNTS